MCPGIPRRFAAERLQCLKLEEAGSGVCQHTQSQRCQPKLRLHASRQQCWVQLPSLVEVTITETHCTKNTSNDRKENRYETFHLYTRRYSTCYIYSIISLYLTHIQTAMEESCLVCQYFLALANGLKTHLVRHVVATHHPLPTFRRGPQVWLPWLSLTQRMLASSNWMALGSGVSVWLQFEPIWLVPWPAHFTFLWFPDHSKTGFGIHPSETCVGTGAMWLYFSLIASCIAVYMGQCEWIFRVLTTKSVSSSTSYFLKFPSVASTYLKALYGTMLHLHQDTYLQSPWT